MNQKAFSSLFGIFILLLLILGFVGLYTFHTAKGTSYLSDDSAACNNCHIMNEVYNDYVAGAHSKKVAGKSRATCVDCHLPHESFVGTWLAKGQSGLGHAYAFTFKLDQMPTNLSANANTKGWVQNNCIRCHSDYATAAINPTTIKQHADKSLKCVSCHESVGHKRGF